MENKVSFNLTDSVLSASSLKLLDKHCCISESDISSYDIWPTDVTNDGNATECFTHNIQGQERSMILNDIYNNQDLPCYKKNWIRDADLAIQKIPQAGYITRHVDSCYFSLTVFLNDVEQGGYFVWWDDNQDKHYIKPVRNQGIYAHYDKHSQGADHEVSVVNSPEVRYTLQLFVFDKTDENINSVKIII